MTPITLADVTVCITSFRRDEYLARALQSCAEAGVQRIVIAAAAPTIDVLGVIKYYREFTWLSYDVHTVDVDIGCNNTWLLAAYASRTSHIFILHDDDMLTPEFASVFPLTADYVSWRAHIIHDDGRREATEWLQPYTPSRELTSGELYAVVADKQRLSLSPVVSILDRTTVIHACKEAELTLTDNRCLERPGMLLGTEILVYMRHIQQRKRWLFIDKVLSLYGSHEGSGTVKAQKAGNLTPLLNGYALARDQGFRKPPKPEGKIIFTYAKDPTPNPRYDSVRNSWQFQFGTFCVLNFPFTEHSRSSRDLGDNRDLPYARDIFDAACATALPEDTIVYCNEDCGLTTDFPTRIRDGVDYGRGVTVGPRRILTPEPDRLYRTVRNCITDGGFDAIAFTPQWWKMHRELMPDMLLGFEAWDTVFRCLAEEWADGPSQMQRVREDDWVTSRAYTDDLIYHQEHMSQWQLERTTSPGQLHNRKLAYDFFLQRNYVNILPCLK